MDATIHTDGRTQECIQMQYVADFHVHDTDTRYAQTANIAATVALRGRIEHNVAYGKADRR
jgi:hypothetical protein